MAWPTLTSDSNCTVPSATGKNENPGAKTCRNGTCTSSECSALCATLSSESSGHSRPSSSASASSIGASPSGVRHAPLDNIAADSPRG